MKTCTKCGNQKLFSQFNKRKASVDGLQPICNLCSKTRLKLNYSKKMDSIDGHIEMILAKIKKRAKDNNLNFNLLDKNFCYSFVLQHPENRIVVSFTTPQLYLISIFNIYHIDENNINETP